MRSALCAPRGVLLLLGGLALAAAVWGWRCALAADSVLSAQTAPPAEGAPEALLATG